MKKQNKHGGFKHSKSRIIQGVGYSSYALFFTLSNLSYNRGAEYASVAQWKSLFSPISGYMRGKRLNVVAGSNPAACTTEL